MTVQHLLARVVSRLDAAEVPYMLTGSYASSLHSVPRATKDLDVIIFPNRDQLLKFLQFFPSVEYHVDHDDAIEALRGRRQFNIIDYATGWKVDFIIPPFDEFNIEEFERRVTIDADGLSLSVVSPEDIVVAKLIWAKAGESERQLADAATVVRVQGNKFDIAYVERWVWRLGLQKEWERVRMMAEAG